MTSLLARAQRIVDLGKAATPAPWNLMEARTLIHIETDHDNSAGAGLPICSMPLKRLPDAEFIYAARDADQIAAKLIEAEALLARLSVMVPIAIGQSADVRAFLATLHQETP